MLTKASRSRPGPVFVAVSAGVGDGHSRLGGEHGKDCFVFRRELPAALFLGQIDIAQTLIQITDRGSQEGLHRRVALGKADRPGVAGYIRHSKRFLYLVQVLEESQTLGQVPEHRAFLGGDAGGEEGFYAPGVVEGHQRAIAGLSQRTGAVYDPLQDGVEVEALADAEAGLAQPGETVSQPLILLPQPLGFLKGNTRPAARLWLSDLRLHMANCTTRITKRA